MSLVFIPDSHTYLLDGERVPSVTQVLDEWREVKVYGRRFLVAASGAVVEGEVMDSAKDFGIAIHDGAKLILTGELDWDFLDPALVAPLRQFEKWVEDYDVQPLYIEQPMASKRHRVAGTPDLIGDLRGFRHLCLVDFKTGAHALVAPQVCAYEMIFREEYKYRKPITKHVLYIPKDGRDYQFKPVEDNEAWSFFLSRLYQWVYLNQRGF